MAAIARLAIIAESVFIAVAMTLGTITIVRTRLTVLVFVTLEELTARPHPGTEGQHHGSQHRRDRSRDLQWCAKHPACLRRGFRETRLVGIRCLRIDIRFGRIVRIVNIGHAPRVHNMR